MKNKIIKIMFPIFASVFVVFGVALAEDIINVKGDYYCNFQGKNDSELLAGDTISTLPAMKYDSDGVHVIPRSSGGVIGSSTVDAIFRDLTVSGSLGFSGLLILGDGLISQASSTMAELHLGTPLDISDYTNLSITAAGLELSGDSIALATDYIIPLTASTTAWNNFYDIPSTQITAGDLIDWTGNTLNVDNDLANYDNTTSAFITLSSLSASAPLSYNSGSGEFTITQADSLTSGYLSGADWNVFNNKMASSTISSLTANYLPKWNGSVFDNSLIYDDGTNVGIGTTSPSAQLHLNTLAGTSAFKIGSSTTQFIVDESGNIGVGTSSPSYKLDIYGDTRIDGSAKFQNFASFYSEYDNGTKSSNFSIDISNGNKQKVILGAAGLNITWAATSSVSNVLIKVIQDGTGSRTVSSWGGVKWPAGTAPTLSTDPNAIDIVSCYIDGSDVFCQAGINFQ